MTDHTTATATSTWRPPRVRLAHTIRTGIGLGIGIAIAQLLIFAVVAVLFGGLLAGLAGLGGDESAADDLYGPDGYCATADVGDPLCGE